MMEDNPLAKINLRELRVRLLSANMKLRGAKKENSYLKDLVSSYKKVIGFYQDSASEEGQQKPTSNVAMTVKMSPELTLVISVEGDAIVKNLVLNGEIVGTSIDYFEEIIALLLPNDI
jgi:hypothetical protein